VTVAVVDTGVNFSHEDLTGRLVAGHDYVDGDNAPEDENGHGTHVTTAIVGDADHQGINGIAPNAHALVLRVLGADGRGFLSDIAAAFDAAGQLGIRIVSASLGGSGDSQLLDAVMRAHPATLYVVAAGNDGSDNDVAPVAPCSSTAPNVICVGASDQADAPADFSNFGATSVDVFAPGVDILSGWLAPANFEVVSGTSMATPIVSGIAALALARNPSLSTPALKSAVLDGAVPVTGLAGLSVTGARADALRAVQLVPDRNSDEDGDGVPLSRDACPGITALHSSNGCPDTIDSDGDGVYDVMDACGVTPGPVALGGCPDTRDRDHDGHIDSLDRCPRQNAHTKTGCPRPRVKSVRARRARCGGDPCLKARITLARSAAVTVKAQRCRRTGGHCTWRTLATRHRHARAFTVAFKTRLREGRYRIRALASNPQGRSRPRSDVIAIH
jgi:subtilisin family serine protease